MVSREQLPEALAGTLDHIIGQVGLGLGLGLGLGSGLRSGLRKQWSAESSYQKL